MMVLSGLVAPQVVDIKSLPHSDLLSIIAILLFLGAQLLGNKLVARGSERLHLIVVFFILPAFILMTCPWLIDLFLFFLATLASDHD